LGRYTDLSGAVENGLWAYDVLPGLESIIPPVIVETIATVDKDGFFASRISLSTISGTYLEAGSHILDGAGNLDEYSVNDFIRPVSIIRLPRQREKAQIDVSLLVEHSVVIRKGDAVIVDTGWGAMWNKPGYVLRCPNFTKKAIEWLLAQGVSILGFDVPCIESSWSEDAAEEKGGLLGMMFKNNVLLAAPLINLEQVERDRGMLWCMPLKVKGTSGAPARIVFDQGASV
jgi:arylformamidase